MSTQSQHSHIVTFQDGSQPDLDTDGIDVHERFSFGDLDFEAAAVSNSADDSGPLERLADHGDLETIDADDFSVKPAIAPVESLGELHDPDPATLSEQAATIEDVREQSNIPAPADLGGQDGTGIELCVMDSGIDPEHPVFDGTEIVHVDATEEPAREQPAGQVQDNVGHGSACAGQSVRIAPGVRLLSLRIFKGEGSTTGRIIMRAYDWLAANAGRFQIVNMSWGTSKAVNAIDRAQNALVEKGVRTVSAAGNSGGTSGSPGTAETAFSVAATTKQGSVTDFSSYNPGGDSPDVAAIGAQNRLAQSRGTVMGRDLKGPWVMASGTSFSAPEVAGMVALYLSAAPNAPPEQVTQHFEQSARDIPDTPRDGAGIADCRAAIALARDEDEEDESGNGDGGSGGGDGDDGSDGSDDESGEDDGSGGNGDAPAGPDTPEDVDFDPPAFTEDGIGQFTSALQRIVDGDTMYVDLALTPFGLRNGWDLRLKGIDTAEIFGGVSDEEYERGIEHKQFVEDWFADASVPDDGRPFLIRTTEIGKYGRKVSLVKRRDDDSVLNKALIEEFGDAVFSPQDFTEGPNPERFESPEKQRE